MLHNIQSPSQIQSKEAEGILRDTIVNTQYSPNLMEKNRPTALRAADAGVGPCRVFRREERRARKTKEAGAIRFRVR